MIVECSQYHINSENINLFEKICKFGLKLQHCFHNCPTLHWNAFDMQFWFIQFYCYYIYYYYNYFNNFMRR